MTEAEKLQSRFEQISLKMFSCAGHVAEVCRLAEMSLASHDLAEFGFQQIVKLLDVMREMSIEGMELIPSLSDKLASVSRSAYQVGDSSYGSAHIALHFGLYSLLRSIWFNAYYIPFLRAGIEIPDDFTKASFKGMIEKYVPSDQKEKASRCVRESVLSAIREQSGECKELAALRGHLQRERAMIVEGDGAKHSSDFRSVNWFGEPYEFSANQAACIKILWEAWSNDTPAVGQATIIVAAEISQSELRLVFREHPAWGTMIRPGQTKGTFRLVGPE